MLINRAYRHKLRLADTQEAFCRRIAGCCRLIYNSALEQRQLGYAATGRGIGYKEQTYGLKEVKRMPEFAFLREVPAHPLQQAMRDLDDGFKRFFSHQNDYPQYRRRGENDSFRFPDPSPQQIGVHHPDRHNQVRLPKLGWCTVENSYPRLSDPRLNPDGPRLFEGRLCNVTVKREADGWYVSFACEVEVDFEAPRRAPLLDLGLERPDAILGQDVFGLYLFGSELRARSWRVPHETDEFVADVLPWFLPVGIDRGVANSVALSTGQLYHLPVITDAEWRKLGNLQTRVNRRAKGSRNREKALRQLGRFRRRLYRRKLDAMHKLTTAIVLAHPLIVLEALRIANMTRSAKGTVEEPGTNVAQKAALNRVILDQCWAEFERQLIYKSYWYGRGVMKVPAHHSSNECNACGYRDPENRESQAVFVCKACGHSQHADLNAANVVLCRALRGEGECLIAVPTELHELMMQAVPSGGTPGCEVSPIWAGDHNACEDQDTLKNPERFGYPRKQRQQGPGPDEPGPQGHATTG